MIRVVKAGKPATFDAEIRQPGLLALRETAKGTGRTTDALKQMTQAVRDNAEAVATQHKQLSASSQRCLQQLAQVCARGWRSSLPACHWPR